MTSKNLGVVGLVACVLAGNFACDPHNIHGPSEQDDTDVTMPECVETNNGIETCDNVDNDCNGQVDDGVDCTPDTDVEINCDVDNDGYDAEGMECGGDDCNDDDGDINPGAEEQCDDIDNDCNGMVDENQVCGTPRDWYRDADSDGYGNSDDSKSAVTQPPGYVLDDSDCNDTANTAYPGADEDCDRIDNDCDGAVDEAVAPVADYVVTTSYQPAHPDTRLRPCFWTGTTNGQDPDAVTSGEQCFMGGWDTNPLAEDTYYMWKLGDAPTYMSQDVKVQLNKVAVRMNIAAGGTLVIVLYTPGNPAVLGDEQACDELAFSWGGDWPTTPSVN